jgi:GAF domain-containing protein
LKEIQRDIAFCNHTIRKLDIFVIPDTLNDTRFATHPLAPQSPNIRFYAGVPLTTSGGYLLGTPCFMGFEARALTQNQRKGLKTLSQQVGAQLKLKRNIAFIRKMRYHVTDTHS